MSENICELHKEAFHYILEEFNNPKCYCFVCFDQELYKDEKSMPKRWQDSLKRHNEKWQKLNDQTIILKESFIKYQATNKEYQIQNFDYDISEYDNNETPQPQENLHTNFDTFFEQFQKHFEVAKDHFSKEYALNLFKMNDFYEEYNRKYIEFKQKYFNIIQNDWFNYYKDIEKYKIQLEQKEKSKEHNLINKMGDLIINNQKDHQSNTYDIRHFYSELDKLLNENKLNQQQIKQLIEQQEICNLSEAHKNILNIQKIYQDIKDQYVQYEDSDNKHIILFKQKGQRFLEEEKLLNEDNIKITNQYLFEKINQLNDNNEKNFAQMVDNLKQVGQQFSTDNVKLESQIIQLTKQFEEQKQTNEKLNQTNNEQQKVLDSQLNEIKEQKLVNDSLYKQLSDLKVGFEQQIQELKTSLQQEKESSAKQINDLQTSLQQEKTKTDPFQAQITALQNDVNTLKNPPQNQAA